MELGWDSILEVSTLFFQNQAPGKSLNRKTWSFVNYLIQKMKQKNFDSRSQTLNSPKHLCYRFMFLTQSNKTSNFGGLRFELSQKMLSWMRSFLQIFLKKNISSTKIDAFWETCFKNWSVLKRLIQKLTRWEIFFSKVDKLLSSLTRKMTQC